MTDTQILDWLDAKQACVTKANHQFYVQLHGQPDHNHKDTIRAAVRRAAAVKTADDDGASLHASGEFYAAHLVKPKP